MKLKILLGIISVIIITTGCLDFGQGTHFMTDDSDDVMKAENNSTTTTDEYGFIDLRYLDITDTTDDLDFTIGTEEDISIDSIFYIAFSTGDLTVDEEDGDYDMENLDYIIMYANGTTFFLEEESSEIGEAVLTSRVEDTELTIVCSKDRFAEGKYEIFVVSIYFEDIENLVFCQDIMHSEDKYEIKE